MDVNNARDVLGSIKRWAKEFSDPYEIFIHLTCQTNFKVWICSTVVTVIVLSLYRNISYYLACVAWDLTKLICFQMLADSN